MEFDDDVDAANLQMIQPIDVASLEPIGHAEAMRMTAVENDKFAAALASIDASQWALPTDCDRWTVRDVAAHIIGSAAGQAKLREFVRQVRAGKPLVAENGGQFWWDGMNEVQVRERAPATTDELQAEWAVVSSRALRARNKMPRPIARLPLLKLPVVGRQSLSYLFDVGFTRDVWMHRIDIAHATGVAPDLDAQHDGRIFADIVREWAGTHGEPFSLVIDGPAGGTFVQGTGGEHVQMGFVQFCRILTERASGEGILRHPMPL
ncbi:MAG: maleylpyruvate isomerase family mycothiol-dependent enzyme [Ilumatobacteraceae bacterium]